MYVNIRKANEGDIPTIHALVRELAEYEKGLHKVTTTPESYLNEFRNGSFEALVAEVGGNIVGMALFYPVFSTWRGRMLYLEDFIVKEKERGKGIGAKLFEAFIEEAKEKDVAVVKWQVLDWNAPGINFYRKYKTEFDKEWVDCKLLIRET
jgi:predicted N-acetyltransferase YhbS